MDSHPPQNHNAGNFYLLIESEWNVYISDVLNSTTVLYENRRKLAKLTKLELGYCFLYILLFLLGLLSNGYAVRVVGTVLVRSSGGRHVNILAYIGTLASVNLAILAFLPITVSDIVAGEWLFPSVLCPVHWVIETMNKTVSPLILACLTVACYCSVCHPSMLRMYRCSWVAFVHVLAVGGIVAWKAKPFVDHSSAFYLVDFVNETLSINYGKKCLFHPPDESDLVDEITWDGFVSVYLLPMLYMAAFYAAILRTIMIQSRNLGRRTPPRHFWRAARSAGLLIGFYFFCWTPYWSITLALVLQSSSRSAGSDPPPTSPSPNGGEELDGENELWSMTAFAAHVLPLVNCSFSPLLYTLTNGHVRTLYRTTTAVMEQRYKLRCRTNSTKLLEDTS